jgi:Mce-associated membrane protein
VIGKRKDKTVKEENTVAADTDTTSAELDETSGTELGGKADSATEKTDASDASEPVETPEAGEPKKAESSRFSRVVAFVVLPALALLLALGAGFLKWQDNSYRYSEVPVNATKHPSIATESVLAAKDSTIALLSYKPETVEQQLTAARDRLTGDFRDSYTSLTNDGVIPGAKQKQISAVASVPAAASVSATPNHAVVLVFVNQTVVVGQDPPTDTASSVRVTLDRVGGRWLISKFDPV